ncbi:MAG: hypothetical protein ACT6Q9_09130 [Polaromonas sp.]|uniref:hypothetical protein n=1 Tax=Polaromonas sp. TaxID=1869339 RepID=UPI0040365E4D
MNKTLSLLVPLLCASGVAFAQAKECFVQPTDVYVPPVGVSMGVKVSEYPQVLLDTFHAPPNDPTHGKSMELNRERKALALAFVNRNLASLSGTHPPLQPTTHANYTHCSTKEQAEEYRAKIKAKASTNTVIEMRGNWWEPGANIKADAKAQAKPKTQTPSTESATLNRVVPKETDGERMAREEKAGAARSAKEIKELKAQRDAADAKNRAAEAARAKKPVSGDR